MLALAACKEPIYSDLDQRQANDIMATLSANGISAVRTGSGTSYAVEVETADLAEAARILNAAGLPRERHQSITDLFPGDSMIVTPYEQEARMAFGMGQELSRSIESIDGVQTARVHVVLPRRDLRDRVVSASTASIMLHHDASVDSLVLNEKVRALVSNAVPELSADRVAITNFPIDSSFVSATTAPDARARASAAKGSTLEWLFFTMAAILAAIAGLWLMATALRRKDG